MSVTWICRMKGFWSQNSFSVFSKAQWSTRLRGFWHTDGNRRFDAREFLIHAINTAEVI